MKQPNYDDPSYDEAWCEERRTQIADYLRHQGVNHGAIGESPAWRLVPYVSIWAVESLTVPGSVGWWAISGDLPTDYLSAMNIKTPRDAMREFASRWHGMSELMIRGEAHPNMTIGSPVTWSELGPLLAERAEILRQWADDDGMWDEPTA